MSTLRRFEILLPKQFNDGGPVPEELFADAATELRERFGAMSWETQVIRGQWKHEGKVFLDQLIRFVVDAPRKPESDQFFRGFKEKLKEQFQQLEIWITAFDIDTI